MTISCLTSLHPKNDPYITVFHKDNKAYSQRSLQSDRMWSNNGNMNNYYQQHQNNRDSFSSSYPQFGSYNSGYQSSNPPSSGYGNNFVSGYGPSASGYGPTSTANGPSSYAYSPNSADPRKDSSPVYVSNPSGYQKSDHSGYSGGKHASYSGGGGYGKMSKCPGIPLSLLLITLLGIAVLGAILFLKIQAAGRRKRRSAFHWEDLADLVAIGRRIFQ